MTKLTGGEAAVTSLLRQGIDTLFCLPGVQNDWFYNAIYDFGQSIKVIQTRHEQGAAYMALGYAMATGEVGLCSVVPGPGLLNATAALSTAYAVNAKVFCLTGQIPSRDIGRGYGVLHEINNQLEILRSLTKWADRANSVVEIPEKINQAFFQLHSGRPRPVGLEIPMDVLQERAPVELLDPDDDYFDPPIDEDRIDEAAELLGRAVNPMIVTGSGAIDSGEQIKQLAECLQAPVVSYRTGAGVLDERHSLSLFHPAAKKIWDRVDVVIGIGSNMRTQMRSWIKFHKPKIIRVDVDPLTHKIFAQPPDIEITGRCGIILPVLLNKLAKHNIKRQPREEEFREVKSAWFKDASILEPQISYLNVIREELGEDGIFVDELTQVGFASQIVFPVYKPRTFISAGYQGTLGYGFPTALGVKLARPDVPVISVTGDGGFMFGAQELATGVQQKIPLIVILFNNNQYGNIQQMQKNYYDGRIIASDLHNPDFIKFAESFGAQAMRASTADEMRSAIQEGMKAPVPTVIEVPVGDMISVDRFRSQ